jgi:transketolase
LFTRQNVPPLPHAEGFDPKTVWRGAYVLVDPPAPDLAIVATGSEVAVAVDAARLLARDGKNARVVSMPCVERFLAQDDAYREQVLPRNLPCASIELGRTLPWAHFTGGGGLHVGRDWFGDSAPWEKLRDAYGITAEAVADRVRAWLAGAR